MVGCHLPDWFAERDSWGVPFSYRRGVAAASTEIGSPWQDRHCRYFQIAGITVQVQSDLDLGTVRFAEAFAPFEVKGAGTDNVKLRHHFGMPDLQGRDLGKELYRRAPWAISRKNGAWIYRGILPDAPDSELHRFAVFSPGHTHGAIYSPLGEAEIVRAYGWQSLSLFPTDQIWLAPLLADRHAVLLHSAAAILNGRGLLFVGHSSAGKSTTVTQLQDAAVGAEILCDDRNVVRRWSGGWRVHGTWSHGDVADVSGKSAPLRAILFLQQDTRNEIVPVCDRKDIWRRLLATLIRPMVCAEWWQKELDVLEGIVGEVPCYTMHFDKSGGIVEQLVRL